jgi:exfoliative toxin A/B
MSFIRRIPIPISALALGLAGLGNLLLPYSPAIRAACGIAAALVVLLVVARIVFDFAGVREELSNPGTLAVFPALFMALMLLATYLKPLAPVPAKLLWMAALVLQLGIAVLFVTRHVVGFKLAKVLPGWFLVFVGFVVASVTSPAFDMQPLGQALLWAGVLGYVAVLPIIVYRMAKGGDLPAPAIPTIAIFAAPPSLCLAGYLAVAPSKSPMVVYWLLGVAGVSLVYVFTHMPRILRAGFFPSYAALTFPLVISAIALKQSNVFLSVTPSGSFIPKLIIVAMDALATGAVLFVAAHYARHMLVPVREG